MAAHARGPTIAGVGARSPLGLSSLQVAMCARAAKAEPRSSAFHDKRGLAIGVCRSRALSDDLFGFDRFVALGAPALREAARPWAREQGAAALPLVLALPESARPDQSERFGVELVATLATGAGVPVDLRRSGIVRAGDAGFAYALETALALVAGGAPEVLVGAIDSYYDPAVLAWLDEDCRLVSARSDAGIVPSEGAAFVLLSAAERAGDPGGAGVGAARVLAALTDSEETVEAGEPNLARAMTGLVTRAVELAQRPIGWIVSDWNGDHHFTREWSAVEIRTTPALGGARHDRPVMAMGSTGAAAGALLVAGACAHWGAGSAADATLLVALHAEGKQRAVILLEEVRA